MKLSNSIHKSTRKYKVPANIYTAILMQESGYRLNAVSSSCGYIIEITKDNSKSINEYQKVCIAEDFGISQIHINTIERYKFNLKQLTTDLNYSVAAGAKVLSWFHNTYAHKEVNWFVRYNCGTKPSINRNTCNTYKHLVIPYL